MSTAPPPRATPPRSRWLRRLGVAALVLALLLGSGVGWLLGSAAGLRFVLARAQDLTHGALSVRHARGRLGGPLQLDGLRYDNGAGSVLTVATARLDLRLWPLLAGRLHVLWLDLQDVQLALPAATAGGTGGAGSLQPPIALLLDHAHLGALRVSRGGQPVFASNRLDLAGRWTQRGIALSQLALQAPDGHVELVGRLGFGAGYPGNSAARFAWKAGNREVAGRLRARSDGRQAHLDLQLDAPTAAQLQLDVAARGDHAWSARLDVPRFDPQPLLGSGKLQALAIALHGHGDRHGGTLEGALDLNAYRLLLQPLRAQLSDNLHTLTLQQLRLGSPQVPGELTASGTVRLDAHPLSAALDLRWSHLSLPASLAGQPLASDGSLHADGSPARWHAAGKLAIGPPGRPAALALNLDGSARQIVLHALTWQQTQGHLQASGTLQLQPALAWQASATARRFDPGQLIAGWSGALDFDLASRGTLAGAGPDATLQIRQLSGRLRQRQISGKGSLHLSPRRVIDGHLMLASGGSSVTLQGRPGTTNDAQVRLAIASLGDWLPAAGGRLDGHFSVRGAFARLAVNGSLQGQALAWRQQRLDSLQLIAGLPDTSRLAGKLDLHLTGAHLGGLTFQRIHVLAEGSQGDHRLAVDARGSQLSGNLSLHGAQRGSRWNGTLSALELDPQGLPRWRLQQPTQLGYARGAISLSELCLSAGQPLLCVTARRDPRGNLDASYRGHALPLAMLLNAAGEAALPIRADGTLDGSGKLHRSAAGVRGGSGSLSSPQGTLTYLDHAEQPLLAWHGLAVQAELGPGRQYASAHAQIDGGGRLDGHIQVSGAQQALSGQLTLQLGSLAPIELFSTELAAVRGDLDSSFQFAGSLHQPAVSGQASVRNFSAEVPAAGLRLSQGRLTLGSSDARLWRVDGSVRSGKGTLAITGSAGIGMGAPMQLTLSGSQFSAVDLPAAKVAVSPALTVQRHADGLDIGGALTLDSAEVHLDKLPGSTATRASPDVVVIDQAPAQGGSSLPINALVKVNLGNHTHVVGKGLDGRLGGTLTVRERPGRATTGQGQVTVTGSYRAYGQQLHIERGQLLFAGTPIDNPGLDLRAMRKLNPNATVDEGQQVGLQISGTARRPLVSVFSNPLMQQSDALSYLVTGKPLSQVKGGEGDLVGSAAQALGSAAGNLLAKSVGARLGVDDIGVASNEALGGSSAFTVGKYLSPRLYLSYGVGLFEPGQVITLRYRLSQRWNFEAQNATDYNRASFNYRIEK